MLRTRLMLGLMLLLIILLAMGLYSIDRCSQLGKQIEAAARDHDSAGHTLNQLKNSCALMTGAILDTLTGHVPQSGEKFNSASASFEEGLKEEKERAHKSAEETLLVLKLGNDYRTYHEQAVAFLQTARQSNSGLHIDGSKLGMSTALLFNSIEKLNVAHEHAATASGKDSGDEVNHTIRLIWLLMIVALVATIFAWKGLTRGLMDPLRSLTASIQQVGEGNLDQQVPVLDNYELGTLASSFNRMAAQLKEYRAHASVELMRLNLTIRATLASFPDPIFVLNSEGAVDFRNPEADQLAVQLLFSGITRLPQKVDERVEHVRKTGQDYLPTLLRDAIKFHLNGQDRYLLPRIVILRDENRKSFGVAVILEDVTRMLLLDDVKSNLISTVSHELKTPLTSVRMALYLLYEKTVGELNDKQMDLVTTAREDADRLLRTLNDLLDLAKLDQGPAQLAITQVAPGDLIEEAVRDARDLAHSAGLPLEILVAPDLPVVQVDRHRLAYVFSNLITNAVKYSPAGSQVLVRADLGKNRDGQPGVRFSVRDHGSGISLEHQEHIFERFYRVPGTRTSGAGLGLSIAREIVLAHQGEMGVITPAEGGGSEFFFILPLKFKVEGLKS